jgi:hypothetical protein
VAIDRKPDNGCEIQDAACGESGVIKRLKVVKAEEDGIEANEEDEERITHGCRVTKYLVGRGAVQIVLNTATELKSMGLRFIGVVKTATQSFQCSGYPPLSLGIVETRKVWFTVAQMDNHS